MNMFKYSEIENTYNKDFKKHLAINNFDTIDAVAVLKVDGSNISFHYNGSEYEVANRTHFIKDDEKFFNLEKFKEQYKQNVIDIYNYLKSKYSNLNTVIVYGEIFGGYYKSVNTKGLDICKIQGRINYSPYNHIIIFDIAITVGENDDVKIYLNWEDVKDLCETFGFLIVPEVARGTFIELMNFNIDNYKDPLYKILNPDLDEIEDNYVEGIVIKPLFEQRFGNGSRVIGKLKNIKFTESKSNKNGEKIDINEQLKSLGEEYVEIYANIIDYITQNRYNSVVSKIGEVTSKDFGTIMKEYHTDVMNDYKKDYPDSILFSGNIEKKNINVINKLINNKISTLVKNILIYDIIMEDNEGS
jgi:Rnl2 family RNA ligase